MTRISVKTLAYKGAPEKMHKEAIENLLLRFGFEAVIFDRPDVLLFLTGGSEAEAIQQLDDSRYQLLAAYGKANAFASATEVKAYSNSHGYRITI